MLLIKNGKIFTMNKQILDNCDILIENGKILKISSNIKLKKESIQVIDATGYNIYPGFIESHCHIGISEEKIGSIGDDINETTNPTTPELRAIDAINPMDSAFHNAISAGVTTVMTGPGSANAIGGQFACIKTFGRCIDDMVIKSPAAIKIALGENPKITYGVNGSMPQTRMAVAALIRRELQNAKNYYEKKQNGEKNFEIDFKYESYIPLFLHEIPLKAHAHRLDDIYTAIRIAKEFNLLLTIDHCTEGHFNPIGIAKSGYPTIIGSSLASRSKLEVESTDFKTPGIMHKNGALISITTDHPVTRIQYLPLCAGLAVKEGLDKTEALRAITINAAKILGIDDQVGSIEKGKDADLVIYDGDPLEINGSVIYTIINGKVVYNKFNKKQVSE